MIQTLESPPMHHQATREYRPPSLKKLVIMVLFMKLVVSIGKDMNERQDSKVDDGDDGDGDGGDGDRGDV
jgi:hypothetical protein